MRLGKCMAAASLKSGDLQPHDVEYPGTLDLSRHGDEDMHLHIHLHMHLHMHMDMHLRDV